MASISAQLATFDDFKFPEPIIDASNQSFAPNKLDPPLSILGQPQFKLIPLKNDDG